MKQSIDDTIAAIATPAGEGGVGIIRVSGSGAEGILTSVFRFEKQQNAIEPRRLYSGWFHDPISNDKIDQATAVFMKAPSSYTGEDVAEIMLHGSPFLLQKSLTLIIAAGARMAERGEFTRRAFLNGKLDLAKAEAIIDLIKAKGSRSLAIATGQLAGNLSKEIEDIRSKLLQLLSQIEAEVDFPEDVAVISSEEIEASVLGAEKAIKRLIETSGEGRLAREGVRIVIIGKPNVGKSSIFNLLLNVDRAIVHDKPGTTRDTIEEVFNMSGYPVVLVDTAGIRRPRSGAEKAGVARAEREIKKADVAMVVIDASSRLGEEDWEILRRSRQTRTVVVLNKTDLGIKAELNGQGSIGKVIQISARKNRGLDKLAAEIKAIISELGAGSDGEPIAVNERHRESLIRAIEAIERTKRSLSGKENRELLSIDLRSAIEALGEVDGKEISEEIIDQIFDQFCVGK